MRRPATHILVLAAKTALSLGLVIFLAFRLDLARVVASLRGASWPLLAAAAGLLVVSNLLGSFQWVALLRAQGNTAPARRVVSAYFTGLFFNNFLPANVGGDLARGHGVARYSNGLSPTVSATLMDRLIGLIAIAAFGCASSPVSMREVQEPVIYAIVGLSFTGALGALVAARSERLRALATSPLRLVGMTDLARRVHRTLGHLGSLASRGKLVAGLLVFSAGIQVLRIYVHYLVARALGIRVSEATLWTFVPILAVVAALPVSLNGLGVREWAATVLLPAAGVRSEAAFAWQLTTYLVAFATSLAGAVLFLRRQAAAPVPEPGRAEMAGERGGLTAEAPRSVNG